MLYILDACRYRVYVLAQIHHGRFSSMESRLYRYLGLNNVGTFHLIIYSGRNSPSIRRLDQAYRPFDPPSFGAWSLQREGSTPIQFMHKLRDLDYIRRIMLHTFE